MKASHPDQLSADTPTKQALTPSRQNVVTPPSKKATPKTAEGETENTSGVQAFCVVCKADYPSIKELVDHVEEAHPYECEVKIVQIDLQPLSLVHFDFDTTQNSPRAVMKFMGHVKLKCQWCGSISTTFLL